MVERVAQTSVRFKSRRVKKGHAPYSEPSVAEQRDRSRKLVYFR